MCPQEIFTWNPGRERKSCCAYCHTPALWLSFVQTLLFWKCRTCGQWTEAVSTVDLSKHPTPEPQRGTSHDHLYIKTFSPPAHHTLGSRGKHSTCAVQSQGSHLHWHNSLKVKHLIKKNMKSFWSFLLLLASLSCEHLLGLRKVELWGDICELHVLLLFLPQVSCPRCRCGCWAQDYWRPSTSPALFLDSPSKECWLLGLDPSGPRERAGVTGVLWF